MHGLHSMDASQVSKAQNSINCSHFQKSIHCSLFGASPPMLESWFVTRTEANVGVLVLILVDQSDTTSDELSAA